MNNEVVEIIDDIKRLRSRIKFFESMSDIQDAYGEAYFSKEWVLKKILKDEQGSN